MKESWERLAQHTKFEELAHFVERQLISIAIEMGLVTNSELNAIQQNAISAKTEEARVSTIAKWQEKARECNNSPVVQQQIGLLVASAHLLLKVEYIDDALVELSHAVTYAINLAYTDRTADTHMDAVSRELDILRVLISTKYQLPK